MNGMRSIIAAAFVFAALASAAAAAPRGPATGSTHVVDMVLQDGAYRFVPAELEARAGDRVVFVLRSGAPHNVAFDSTGVSAAAAAALNAGMPDRMGPLSGALLLEDGARYTVSLAGVPPGRYSFYCMPHIAMGMTGTLTVVP